MANSMVNWLLALIIVFYSIYLMIVGRRINRWMWGFSAFAGLWFLVMYSLFLIDKLFVDFMDAETVKTLCIKPSISIIECALLAWVIKSGWRT